LFKSTHTDEDMKENVSGCFFLNTVYITQLIQHDI